MKGRLKIASTCEYVIALLLQLPDHNTQENTPFEGEHIRGSHVGNKELVSPGVEMPGEKNDDVFREGRGGDAILIGLEDNLLFQSRWKLEGGLPRGVIRHGQSINGSGSTLRDPPTTSCIILQTILIHSLGDGCSSCSLPYETSGLRVGM
jgi:hypothetical protein